MLFFHCSLSDSSNNFLKIEWALRDEGIIIEEGEVLRDSPSYLHDLIHFLLGVGKAHTLVGYDLKFKLTILGRVMKRTGLFQVSLERPDKIVHLDLKEHINKPESLIDLYESYQQVQHSILSQ